MTGAYISRSLYRESLREMRRFDGGNERPICDFIAPFNQHGATANAQHMLVLRFPTSSRFGFGSVVGAVGLVDNPCKSNVLCTRPRRADWLAGNVLMMHF